MDELRPSARVLFLAPYASERLKKLRFLMNAHSCQPAQRNERVTIA